MFPDGTVASHFVLLERKCSYLCCFGIAPYVRNLLKKHVRSQPSFVLLFDESVYKKSKSKQLDVHIRIWEGGVVHTRYFNSAFLGHASADHILQSILEITTGLELRKLIQVSMDGPNVNWKFHRLLKNTWSPLQPHRSWMSVAVASTLFTEHSSLARLLLAGTYRRKLLSSLYYLFKGTLCRFAE